MTVHVLVLVMSVALLSCDSDAQQIRDINEGLATPLAEGTPLSAKITVEDIRDGDCINVTLPEDITIETVVIVPCSGTWQYRVLNSFDVVDDDPYPGEDFFLQRAYERCDRRHSFLLFPFAESWKLGDRTVNCLQDSFGLSDVDPGKLDRLVSTSSLSPEECYNEAPETGDLSVELVDCSGKWEFRVLNSFDVEDMDPYPGEDLFEQRAYEDCDRRHSYFLFPLAESWKLGDRTVNCVQNSFELSNVDPGKLDRLVSTRSLSPEDCFSRAPETDGLLVELVDCSGKWEFRVLSSFDAADTDRYPGEDLLEQRADEDCDRRSNSLVVPNRDTWKFGDRTIFCLQKR